MKYQAAVWIARVALVLSGVEMWLLRLAEGIVQDVCSRDQ